MMKSYQNIRISRIFTKYSIKFSSFENKFLNNKCFDSNFIKDFAQKSLESEQDWLKWIDFFQ